MAAKKKAKAGASARAGATKKKQKAPARKTKAKKSARKTVAKKAKKAPAKKVKKAPAKKAKKKTKKTAPGVLARAIKAVKKAITPAKPKKKKQVVGEGNYAASRKFDADQAGFVKKNKARIPDLGKAAEAALEGPEGDSLRDAEARAAGHSRDTFDA